MILEKTGLYIDQLQSQGRYTYTREELAQKTGQSTRAIRRALERLQEKGRIALITRGFYVIVPLEYSKSGILPAEWFIHHLMSYLGLSYYVGLLSAAALHGAAHQQPQEFQILIDKQRRPILMKGLRLHFLLKKNLGAVSGVIHVKTETGFMNVSNPGLTALDLMRYSKAVGGLNRVATVLSELAEKIEPAALLSAAQNDQCLAFVQRLGFLLDHLGYESKTLPLSGWFAAQKPFSILLDPAKPRGGSPFNKKWMIFVNQAIEADDL
jgi:predicted transcriptional regulator of viral defense system